ncbi:hypothetical protein ABFX02_06G147600 [Erythranthe guttata]
MAPPPSTAVSPVVALIIRLITLISLVICLIIVSTNTATTYTRYNTGTTYTRYVAIKIKSTNFYAYRYMLASAAIGMAYTILQTLFAIFHVTTGNRRGGDGFALVEFFGDKALSYVLATGVAACFGLSVDLNRADASDAEHNFLNKANTAAGVLFIGFIFSIVSSVFSSFSLPKRVAN